MNDPERSGATGIVLAGGSSTRFGEDKLAATVNGIPLLHHPLLRLAEVCSELVVALGPYGPEPAWPPGLPVRVARDAVPDAGPLAGLCAALDRVRTKRALVAAGDMPSLRSPLLVEMLRAAGGEGVEAVALAEGAIVRPLPCVVLVSRGRAVARELLRDGESSLRALVSALHVAVIEETAWRRLDPDGATLVDIDVPEDLAP